MLQANGVEGLPLVKVNGVVRSSGVYPTREELAAWAGVSCNEASPKASSGGCCGPAKTAPSPKNSARRHQWLLLGRRMSSLVMDPSRILFFTGKGGVGKTSAACATAISIADAGKRVLLVSTDPASNLDEVLGVKLTGSPTPVPKVEGLFALNIDPEQAAHDYRERIVGPYRNVLPEAAIASMEEQLSGACIAPAPAPRVSSMSSLDAH